MLQQLIIQNYAIITEIQVDFSDGLIIITGETGAGKSILVGALSLILGERADVSVLMDKNRKCYIEGTFKNEQAEAKLFLQRNDLDVSEDIVIRREIGPNGKSRAFINDTPVRLDKLKELSSLLVDLHQQFDALELGENDFQRKVIDALANNAPFLEQYRLLYKKLIILKNQLLEWEAQQLANNRELDYHTFLFTELEDAGFKDNELEEMEHALKLLNNAEGIKLTLNKIYADLQQNDQPLIQQIKALNNQLQTIGNFHPDINHLSARLHSTQIELQDIADEIERLESTVHFDADKIQVMNERLSLGYRLLKKHGVNSTNQLVLVQADLSEKLRNITNLETQVQQKKIELEQMNEEAAKEALKMSIKRQKQIKPFEDKVNALLVQVGMPNAKLRVTIQPDQSLNLSGSDHIEFLFDANKSNRFEPLSKVASGGELSRLMLIIKSLVAKSVHLPTLIFDEIDTGISGEAARQVGIIMKQLSKEHQVIAITHQPQIAARASTHYFVYKEIKEDRIETSIKELNEDERITTIATMLSGERPTSAAFENAREMIRN